MYASLFVLALTVPGAAPTTDATDSVKWQDSYQTARAAGREQDKPLAVFIGSGSMGWKNFIDEGSLSEKAQKSLGNDYVCVYVDRDQPAGNRLAEQFGVSTGSGLVFSTRDGTGQAFFHAGKIGAAEFQTRMTKYAGTAVVSTTETLTDSRASFSYDPATAGSSMMRGTMTAPPVMRSYPSNFGSIGGYSGGSIGGYSGGYSSGFGGYSGGSRSSCPNCRR
jgi:hypothetical protein